MSDYQKTIEVNRSPEEVFDVITKEMSNWWSSTTNTFTQVGDVGKVTFEGMRTHWTFKAKVLDRPKQVVLECIDSYHVHIGEKEEILEEWNGTELIFDISQSGEKTKIVFTHKGLTPDLHCFNVCREGWNHFAGDSLREYLS